MITMFTTVPFQWNSWLAMAEMKTRSANETTKPIGFKTRPNKTTEPVTHRTDIQSHFASLSDSPFLDIEVMVTMAPIMARTIPNQNGKYPGPILAGVPMG